MIKKFFKNKKILIISILLFCFVVILLGLPYKNWWFFGADDFHALFEGYKLKTFKDLFYCFLDGNIAKGAGPSNYIQPTGPSSFFTTFYRPLYLIYFGIQYWLFGSYAYPYFLLNIFFHAINAVILFNIFTYFIKIFPAILLSLFFAFHPQIAYRFGAIVNLHYYINLTLMLLSILLFKKYLDTKKIKYNIFAGFLFLLSLFTRETSVVLPIIIFFGTYLYINKLKPINLKTFFSQFFINLKLTLNYWLCVIFFLSLRLYLYPLDLKNLNTHNISIFAKFRNLFLEKIPEFKVFIYDLFGLSWLAWGKPILRGSIIIFLFLIIFTFFIKNYRKIYVLYFFLSGLLLLWPSLLGHYNPRYIYESYPFLFLSFIFLFKYNNINLKKFKKFIFTFTFIFILFLIIFTVKSFSKREAKYNIMRIATEKLIQNPKIQNRALCFFGYPTDMFGQQNADIFWILLNNPKLQIYFDPTTAITQSDSNLVQDAGWGNIISNFYDKNYVTITQIKNGFNFKTNNPHKVNFDLNDCSYSLGKKIINKIEKINGINAITDFTLKIDKKYLDQKPLFIKWNYETKYFEILK
ncbi:hypothetical protein KJ644_02335 [Candidatus Dependentiae bacterium]|nr:hypothetical protein [Candidatus Dependentiae bacterium]MBU4387292.1 hypothetical protein [Candidatus Dependentiae bacterium]MCG2756589.1 hypothetical protein [Candidatus Dependentiae bacterium]